MKTSLLICVSVLLSCSSAEYQPLIYSWDDVEYNDCILKTERGEKIEVQCFGPEGQLVLQHKYMAGLKDGPFRLFYENGALKSKGYFCQGQLCNWQFSFYENSDTMSVTHYSYKDSTIQVYEKHYDGQGEVMRSKLPVQISIDSTQRFRVGDEVEVNMNVSFSPFDNPAYTLIVDSLVGIDMDQKHQIFYTSHFSFKVTISDTSDIFLAGALFELDNDSPELNWFTLANQYIKLEF